MCFDLESGLGGGGVGLLCDGQEVTGIGRRSTGNVVPDEAGRYNEKCQRKMRSLWCQPGHVKVTGVTVMSCCPACLGFCS